MLDFKDPYGLMLEDVEAAVIVAAQAELIRVAREYGLGLEQDSFDVYTDEVREVISNPGKLIPPEQLIAQAGRFAEAGARQMLRSNEARFHEGTWAELSIWPFT